MKKFAWLNPGSTITGLTWAGNDEKHKLGCLAYSKPGLYVRVPVLREGANKPHACSASAYRVGYKAWFAANGPVLCKKVRLLPANVSALTAKSVRIVLPATLALGMPEG
ncbi:hypothetical protein AYI74_10685 [Shewanella algae]|nr:hypothetical protein AYI97_16910 [Shewanella algae]PST66802.1 hypothetical protein AYI77_11620 [Shewanella algae]TVL50755.1 hypothetical protein AYJ00_08325 [Shewanella algae]TVO81841.1 hypothetical protein AYI78_16485 [Shewanella algae]TVO82812.1 hypothetical protein AYI76_13735 [Shewanella algae]